MVVSACGSSPPLEERDELQGFADADVQEIIETNDIAYDSEAEKVEAFQLGAMGWASCRDLLAVYRDWLETGELGPAPEPRLAEEPIEANEKLVDEATGGLYALLAEGDEEGFVAAFTDQLNCGQIPANETGDRTVTIADAVDELDG